MYDIDSKFTIDLIERMKLAKIGNYSKWGKLAKKIQENQILDEDEINYFTTFSRIYKNAKTTAHSKILHVRLSEEDQKPKCQMCENKSEFYCNQNDSYFCNNHIVGHDENER